MSLPIVIVTTLIHQSTMKTPALNTDAHGTEFENNMKNAKIANYVILGFTEKMNII